LITVQNFAAIDRRSFDKKNKEKDINASIISPRPRLSLLAGGLTKANDELFCGINVDYVIDFEPLK